MFIFFSCSFELTSASKQPPKTKPFQTDSQTLTAKPTVHLELCARPAVEAVQVKFWSEVVLEVFDELKAGALVESLASFSEGFRFSFKPATVTKTEAISSPESILSANDHQNDYLHHLSSSPAILAIACSVRKLSFDTRNQPVSLSRFEFAN